ncbi:hypothetical protein A9Q99_10810 [Gammaproteobacteria bacterium 45_16_T64]|nr:hypothetical protein A9Q99_10810 [Gammaproteobacteria bacterium 45_16_T64]
MLNQSGSCYVFRIVCVLLISLTGTFSTLKAAVLPEDRADVMFHSYDGGGVTIEGPSVLVRKSFLDKFSVSANYYVDNISGASIDVEVLASEYKEERTEYSLGLDYLFNKTIMSVGFTNSSENDYEANTAYGSISQDFFGDLTNVSLSYAQGWDEVSKTADADFGTQDAGHQKYILSISQVISKSWIVNIVAQTDVDDGLLRNPYRQYSFLNGASRDFADEIYPETRTSDAIAARFKHFLPYRAALGFEYRIYQDSWGIDAWNFDINYTHPWGEHWVFDIHHRWYSQTKADFYSDLFDENNTQNFKARDKELSTYKDTTIGVGVTFEYEPEGWGFMEKMSVSLLYDRIEFVYDDFRDARESVKYQTATAGNESTYSIEADVIRLFFSMWY